MGSNCFFVDLYMNVIRHESHQYIYGKYDNLFFLWWYFTGTTAIENIGLGGVCGIRCDYEGVGLGVFFIFYFLFFIFYFFFWGGVGVGGVGVGVELVGFYPFGAGIMVDTLKTFSSGLSCTSREEVIGYSIKITSIGILCVICITKSVGEVKRVNYRSTAICSSRAMARWKLYDVYFATSRIRKRISNYNHLTKWDAFTHPFRSFKGCLV